jgi:protein-disulfide isomerase
MMRGRARRLAAALCLAAAMAMAMAMAMAPQVHAAAAEFTPAQRQAIEKIVHDYFVNHPEAMVDALRAADSKLKRDAQDKAQSALLAHRSEIFDDPNTPVGGNPRGSVSLVEFFDYRCPYCKEVEPSIEKLADNDKNLRFVYKEFPVLGPASLTAAKVALASRRQGKYADFHRAMMAVKGAITDAVVFKVAASVGLNIEQLTHDMKDPEIERELKSNNALARSLDIDGTPGFVIGDKIVPGAISLDELKKLIADAPKG